MSLACPWPDAGKGADAGTGDVMHTFARKPSTYDGFGPTDADADVDTNDANTNDDGLGGSGGGGSGGSGRGKQNGR